MSKTNKTTAQILAKLGIDHLNEMQEEAILAIHSSDEVVLLSPTGTGKTLAFLLPIVQLIQSETTGIQALILAPSRELCIQIEQVARNMATGLKISCFYGGTSFSKDKTDLKTPPSILIGTPGRIADHLRRHTFEVSGIKSLVLDEYDKSLEIGFEVEMSEIVLAMPSKLKRIFTSATKASGYPFFLQIHKPILVDFSREGLPNIKVKRIVSPDKDKLETLFEAMTHLRDQKGIVFCSFKDAIERVSAFLSLKDIAHGCYHGGMEQQDRERSLVQFRNGSNRLLIATDLAARGLDIPEINFILHYHLPLKREEFIHRNGRTARMHKEGVAYALHWSEEELPEYLSNTEVENLEAKADINLSEWSTLHVSAGRKDKISKGDIVGYFIKQGNLSKEDIGPIELHQEFSFVAIKTLQMEAVIALLDGGKMKSRKVKVSKL